MIDKRYLQRAERLSRYAEKPILYIRDMLGDGVDHWFVALDFTPANPSNHIHVNELRAGKLIDEKMLAPGEVDSQSFVTWLETIDRITILFPPNISWAIIKH